jgi:hypothetical protein
MPFQCSITWSPRAPSTGKQEHKLWLNQSQKAKFLELSPAPPSGLLELTEATEVDFSFYFRLRGPKAKNTRPPGESHTDPRRFSNSISPSQDNDSFTKPCAKRVGFSPAVPLNGRRKDSSSSAFSVCSVRDICCVRSDMWDRDSFRRRMNLRSWDKLLIHHFGILLALNSLIQVLILFRKGKG